MGNRIAVGPLEHFVRRMARYWISLTDLADQFRGMGIPLETPGFYDHPRFVAAEQRDPEFLNTYARFVTRREYPETYLQKARREIPFIAQQFHASLAAEGTRGACVDASMALSRILDREGFWNFCTGGGLRIEYPANSGLTASRFPHVDFGNHAAGHAWIYAPPFRILDITIQLQEYDGAEANYLPPIVFAYSSPAVRAEASDVISERLMADFQDRFETELEVTAGIRRPEGTIPNVRVSIVVLTIGYVPNERVGAEEPSQGGIVDERREDVMS